VFLCGLLVTKACIFETLVGLRKAEGNRKR